MIKTFMLVAYVWSAPLGGYDTFILDQGLSGSDCISAIMKVDNEPISKLAPNVFVKRETVRLACELETGASWDW